jgi:hypothetical protein
MQTVLHPDRVHSVTKNLLILCHLQTQLSSGLIAAIILKPQRAKQIKITHTGTVSCHTTAFHSNISRSRHLNALWLATFDYITPGRGPCYGSAAYMLVSHHKALNWIPVGYMWDLWWMKSHWGRFLSFFWFYTDNQWLLHTHLSLSMYTTQQSKTGNKSAHKLN